MDSRALRTGIGKGVTRSPLLSFSHSAPETTLSSCFWKYEAPGEWRPVGSSTRGTLGTARNSCDSSQIPQMKWPFPLGGSLVLPNRGQCSEERLSFLSLNTRSRWLTKNLNKRTASYAQVGMATPMLDQRVGLRGWLKITLLSGGILFPERRDATSSGRTLGDRF